MRTFTLAWCVSLLKSEPFCQPHQKIASDKQAATRDNCNFSGGPQVCAVFRFAGAREEEEDGKSRGLGARISRSKTWEDERRKQEQQKRHYRVWDFRACCEAQTYQPERSVTL